MRGVLSVAMVFSGATALVHAPALPPDPGTRIDEIFAQYNHTNSPGCAVGVIQEGRLVFARGYGMASLELGVPNSPQTVFYIGSTSKQFVAAAAMLAEVDGYLSLDDDIRQYVPEIPDYGQPITIRHLIHHTSGLRDYLSLMNMGGWPFENVYTDAWTIDLVARQQALNFEPGERNLYSNSGYFLLAEIVGRATGSSLREYTDRRMFEPLGMVHTHFHDDRRMVVPNRAMAYSPGGNGEFRLEWYTNFDKVGSGGLLTTVEDMFLWDQNFYHDRLADGMFRERMLTRGALTNGTELAYAFGLAHGEYRGRATVRHGGAFMGFRAEHLRFPNEALSITVLCNLASTQPARLADQVADIYLQDDVAESQADDGMDEHAAEFVKLPSQTLEALAGAYLDTERRRVWVLTVAEENLEAEGSPVPLTFSPLDQHHFVAVGAPAQIEAYFLPDGTGFRVSLNGDAWAYLEPVELVTPSADQLHRFAGRYYSEELKARFAVSVEEDVLKVQRGQRPPPPDHAEPTTADAFQVGGLTLEFDPGENPASGFSLTSGRVRGVRFMRED